jgi:hypothetical protein
VGARHNRSGANEPSPEAPKGPSGPSRARVGSAYKPHPRANAHHRAKPADKDLVSITNVKRAAAVAIAAVLLMNAQRPEALGPVMQLTFYIHEAGHLIFSMFPQFVHIAAGSVFQCVVPIVAIGAAWRRGALFSACLGGFWLSYNLFYVAMYAKDAVDMELPGLRGEIHDWNYMLDVLGLFGATPIIAGAILTLGVLVALASAGLAVLVADEEV